MASHFFGFHQISLPIPSQPPFQPYLLLLLKHCVLEFFKLFKLRPFFSLTLKLSQHSLILANSFKSYLYDNDLKCASLGWHFARIPYQDTFFGISSWMSQTYLKLNILKIQLTIFSPIPLFLSVNKVIDPFPKGKNPGIISHTPFSCSSHPIVSSCYSQNHLFKKPN